mmetsp:Transcript_60333/g.194276  ORF Transcript_60333/g.194276 Transcript_60333/m.194276 type:complete len:307 (-) Transcript_60333:582-1502(-)
MARREEHRAQRRAGAGAAQGGDRHHAARGPPAHCAAFGDLRGLLLGLHSHGALRGWRALRSDRRGAQLHGVGGCGLHEADVASGQLSAPESHHAQGPEAGELPAGGEGAHRERHAQAHRLRLCQAARRRQGLPDGLRHAPLHSSRGARREVRREGRRLEPRRHRVPYAQRQAALGQHQERRLAHQGCEGGKDLHDPRALEPHLPRGQEPGAPPPHEGAEGAAAVRAGAAAPVAGHGPQAGSQGFVVRRGPEAPEGLRPDELLEEGRGRHAGDPAAGVGDQGAPRRVHGDGHQQGRHRVLCGAEDRA